MTVAAQLHNISEQIDGGVLTYHDAAAIAYVRRELWLAAKHLVDVLDNTRPVTTTSWVGDTCRGQSHSSSEIDEPKPEVKLTNEDRTATVRPPGSLL